MDDGWHVWFAESDSYCSIYLFVIFIDALCFTSSSDDSSVWFWDGLTPLFERCCPLARITTPSFSSPFCTYFVLNAHWFVFAHIHRINSWIIWTGWRLINGSTCTPFLRLFFFNFFFNFAYINQISSPSWSPYLLELNSTWLMFSCFIYFRISQTQPPPPPLFSSFIFDCIGSGEKEFRCEGVLWKATIL